MAVSRALEVYVKAEDMEILWYRGGVALTLEAARRKEVAKGDGPQPCIGRITSAGVAWDTQLLRSLNIQEDEVTAEWQYNAY